MDEYTHIPTREHSMIVSVCVIVCVVCVELLVWVCVCVERSSFCLLCLLLQPDGLLDL